MIRRALLIGVGATRGEAALPGAYQDIAALQRYLISITGGAWEESEIAPLLDVQRKTVLDARPWLNEADYAFVAFSGHGCERELQHHTGLRYPMTCMLCADGLEVQRAELTPSSYRSVVLLDTCRVYQPILDKTASIGATLMDGRRHQISRQTARRWFEQGISEAQLGPELVYGCQFDGTASDLPSFTASLVATARYWGEQASGTLNLGHAFNNACALHEQVSPGRRPEIDLGRGSSHRPVPFAVGNML